MDQVDEAIVELLEDDGRLAPPEIARRVGLSRSAAAVRVQRLIGSGQVLTLRYLLRRLTLADAVARLGARTGVNAAIVAAHDGRAAIDVDKPADLDLARRLLA